MAKHQPIIGDARRETAFGLDRLAADRNGEVGAQAQFTPRRVHQGEGAAADFLAGTVQENLGRLQHRRFFAAIAARLANSPSSDTAWPFSASIALLS